jgi:hypothetical protein
LAQQAEHDLAPRLLHEVDAAAAAIPTSLSSRKQFATASNAAFRVAITLIPRHVAGNNGSIPRSGITSANGMDIGRCPLFGRADTTGEACFGSD